MMIDNAFLFETIQRTIKAIDLDLSNSCDKGIFFAPELFISFRIGQELIRNRESIFESNRVNWLRETKIVETGLHDVVFELDHTKVVFEVKLRNNIEAYRSDILKLRKLPANHLKYFIVLLDSFTQENDTRLVGLELEFKQTILNMGHSSFPTWNNWYQKQVYCNLNLYQILS
jgi:hypothetical protein